MIDYRIINFSHSLRDLETGQAAERFFRTLASSHKDIKLDDASNVGSSDWELVQNHKDGSDWIFENIVQVKLDTPPIDRGWHRFARLRSIYIDKDKSKNLFLHAGEIEFTDQLGKKINLKAELPQHFRKYIKIDN